MITKSIYPTGAIMEEDHQDRSSTRVLLLQYEDRVQTNFESLIEINRQYCEIHGYTHKILREYDAHLPPYWIKVHLALDELRSGNFDFVMWVDSDAVVHDKTRTVESMFEGLHHKDFIYASDAPLWSSPFNAGVWIVRRTESSIRLFEEWMKKYNPDRWKCTEGEHRVTWKCSGPWAGKDYEQGAMVQLIQAETFSEILHQVPYHVLQTPGPYTTEGTFILHFAGHFKPKIRNYLNGRTWVVPITSLCVRWWELPDFLHSFFRLRYKP